MSIVKDVSDNVVMFESGSIESCYSVLQVAVVPGKVSNYVCLHPRYAYMQPGDKLTVAGPDPWQDRRWFASIVMNKDRKLVVK